MKSILIVLFCSICFVSCQQSGIAGFTFVSTPIDGWESTDSLSMPFDSVKESGKYLLSLGLRTSATRPYPYRSLVMRVDIKIDSTCLKSDTVVCNLTDEDGDVNGKGVGLYQYSFNVDTISLNTGMKGNVTVRHLMMRNLLEGISDIGYKLVKIENE